MIEFTLEAYQNEYLPIGGSSVHAIVTVAASGSEADDRTPGDAAEIIIIDTSGSMSGGKIRSARTATVAAIECLPDGTPFAVVGGCDDAYAVHPEVGLAIASPQQRQAAAKAVGRLRARGGTAMSTWLECADRTFDLTAATRRHAILLTDGRNESEDPAQLADQLQRCEGRFQCDCRGVGTDWVVDELRLIASRLLGSLDIIANPAGLAEDFRSMMESSMAREVGEVTLRVWTPEDANVAFLKQVSPVIEELTERATHVDARTHEYPTGAWGNESRDYHVCIDVPTQAVGDEMMAARIMLMARGDNVAQARVRAIWTDDAALSTRINREVAHYTGQAELAEAIKDGIAARAAGDDDTATVKLGRATQIAHESANDDTLRLLAKVVDIDDPSTGTVRLRRSVEPEAEMTLDTRSTKTIRVQRAPT
jgi:hypothetical protein